MDDVLNCPICGTKMRTIHHKNKHLYPIEQTADYEERLCTGPSHVIAIWFNKGTKKVDFMKLSLNPKYSRFLEIDWVHEKCRITCVRDGEYEYIEIPKMIEPDFPDLTKLKEKVNLYVVFS
jgi:hypothetical protein